MILQVVVERREHLENMDYLREGVHLRAMACIDPLVEYTQEGHTMFEELGRAIRGEEVVFTLFHAEPALEAAADLAPQEAPTIDGGLAYSHDSMAGADAITAASARTAVRAASSWPCRAPSSASWRNRRKIGRNDPCWCGSGKKYKKCHGA